MIRSVILSAISVALVTSADATDIYSAPEPVLYQDRPYAPPSWEGAYVGINGGYASFHFNYLETSGVSIPWGVGGSALDTNVGGGFGGGHIGYNVQHGRVVLGIEGTYEGIGADGIVRRPSIPSTAFMAEAGAFGSIAVRLGYARDENLIYAKSGYAIAGATLLGSSIAAGNLSQFKADTILNGLVVGGGFERQITPNWAFGVECSYLAFAPQSFNAIDNLDAPFRSEAEVSAYTVTFRLTYRPGF